MEHHFIGLDAGGTMLKAALFDAHGQEVACVRSPQPMLFPGPGHTERDAHGMWQAAAEAMRSVLQKAAVSAGSVAGVSVTGYGSGLYVVDGAGQPLRPGILSTDARCAALVREWQVDGRAAMIAPRIGQRIWPGQSTMLMAWLARHEPGVVAGASHVLLCKDYLRAQLCGDVSTDPSDAGVSGLYDISNARYVEDMFGDLGLAAWRGKLPEVAPSLAVAGTVSLEAASLTGLLAGTPVVRGVLDVAAGAIATGVVQPRQMNIIAGTFSINQTLHQAPRASTPPFLQCAYPLGKLFLATEGGATSASNLEWFCKSILDAEGERAQRAGRTIYDACNAMIAAAPDRCTSILFFPFLFSGPGGMPAALIGMQASDRLGDVLRAVFEGIAFAHKVDVLRLLSGVDAARPDVIRLAGGAAQSPIWAQMFADILELPVEVTHSSELGALGAAMCTSVALGLHSDLGTAVDEWVQVRRRFEPRPEKAEPFRRKFARYHDVMALLAAVPAP
jgi:L-xylulokinase